MTQPIFRLEVLHAGHGDCLWIEYGDPAAPHRIVIDCGTAGTSTSITAKLQNARDQPGSNELLVITHVDADHIAGALPLIANPANADLFTDVWFNGRRHLEPGGGLESFGAVQGERLTQSLLDNEFPWNRTVSRGSICVQEDGTPQTMMLPGGAKLTILSPTWQKLRALQPKWDREVKDAGLDPQSPPAEPVPTPAGFEAFGFSVDALADFPFAEDDTAPNGSSIAFLLEYQERSMLLGADAHPSVLLSACERLNGGKKVPVTLLKIPHHGSKNNVSRELIEFIPCEYAVFSSNGAYFGHPDKEAVARVIKYAPAGVELVFNCRTKFNELWDSDGLRKKWAYTTRYGKDRDGIVIDLL
jgi:hypothetical protein